MYGSNLIFRENKEMCGNHLRWNQYHILFGFVVYLYFFFLVIRCGGNCLYNFVLINKSLHWVKPCRCYSSWLCISVCICNILLFSILRITVSLEILISFGGWIEYLKMLLFKFPFYLIFEKWQTIFSDNLFSLNTTTNIFMLLK